MTKKITPNFLRQFFVLIIFLQSFTILSQNVAITISVNWPNWSSENKIELLDPSNNIIFSIDNGYTGSGNAAYQNTVSTNPNVPVNNSSTNGYSVRIYDLYGDGWNSNGFATVNIDGIDILTVNNSNFSAIPGSGGEIVSNRIFFAVEQAPNLDDASFTYPNSSYSISDTDPTPTITGETGGTFTSTAGLVIDNSTGLIDVSASTLGSYTVTYTTNEPYQNSAQQNITISFATSQYHDNSKKYIEYIPGTMPVIISAPHGGVLQSGRSFGGVFYPDNDNSLPDRNCGTNEQDDNTDVLIKEIQKKCFEQFGEYPYIIVSNLHRSKLDPNRNKSVATCNNSNAGVYFDAYHNFIDQASADITAKFGKGLYIDLHGQSHSVPRVEAGYNLYSSSYDENLDNSATNAVELSRVTIKNLIENNIQNLSFEDLIRGSQSFGGLLQTTGGSEYASLGHAGCNRTEGYRTVPSHISSGSSQGSCDDTNPGNFAYFAGDYYSNIRHGSGDPAHAHSVVQGGGNVNGGGGTIDGIMTEVNRRVRDMGNLLTSYDGRQDTRSSTIPFFARDYAQVLEKYIDLHYNNFSNFSYNSSSYDISDADPTPTITGISGGVFSSTSGLSINSTTGNIDLSNSSPGNYLVTYIAPNITNYYKKEFNITITGVVLDNADFSYAIDTACQNNSDLTPTISGESGGTFSSTIGLSINSTTGVIDNSTSTAGSYTVTYTTTNPGSNSATDIVTIHENPTLSITNPTAVCAGETIDLTSNAITNGSSAGTLTYFSDANATSTLANANAIATSGTYYIKLSNTNGCETVEAVNVTVNENPTLVSITPSNNSLNVALDSNLVISFSENIVASSGNLTLKKVIDNSIVETILSSSTNITGNQVSINPTKDLELNTSYYLEISNSAFTSTNGCNFSGISNSTEWSFKTIKNQNNTFLATNGLWSLDANWSLGRKPITTDNVIIPSGRTANLNENNIDITNLNVSGIFNIQKNIALTVNENITNTGTFTVNSGASLIVNGNATGIFNYKRTLEANKWYLVGSPVSGQTIVDFINSNSSISRGSGSGDDQNIAFAPFNNNTSVSNEKWTYFKEGQIDGENADDTTEIITPGTGYTIRLSSTTDIIFSGTLESSNIWKTATKNISAYNLISNPYSSFINSADFLIENNGVGKSLKTQTLWVWNTSLNGGLGDYETRITLNDFKIAPGQAFFIEVDNNLGVNFQKESQVHESGDTFLKTSKSKIKLSITEGTNSKSTEIYFIEGASKGFDNGYDGEIFGGINTDFNIYTYLVSGDTSKKLSIQSLPNTNFEDLVIPLGIKVNTGKEINFSLSTKNIPSGLHFYLEDKKNKTLTKLDNNTSTYKVLFTDEMKETGNFFLHTKSKVLSTETTISSNVKVYNVGNQLLINGITNKNIELNLFTVLGKKVLKKSFSSNGNSSIEIPKLPAGIYLVKLKNDNTDITKKIILE